MILEYENLIGLFIKFKDWSYGKGYIGIDSEKITIINNNRKTIEREFVKSIGLYEYGFVIEYIHTNGVIYTTSLGLTLLIKGIKSYYIYNKRKNIIESL